MLLVNRFPKADTRQVTQHLRLLSTAAEGFGVSTYHQAGAMESHLLQHPHMK